jgi:hypothetical protein
LVCASTHVLIRSRATSPAPPKWKRARWRSIPAARYRWALVLSLRKLGRDGEARRHTEEILARAPEDAAHRERFARLFPGSAR